ncbi:MAG: hypothetical protein LBJ93_02545 [Clostridiales bacterium]|jgi:hypothetical protein|nr:hypothetical protein [Clostridiales bacterium]
MINIQNPNPQLTISNIASSLFFRELLSPSEGLNYTDFSQDLGDYLKQLKTQLTSNKILVLEENRKTFKVDKIFGRQIHPNDNFQPPIILQKYFLIVALTSALKAKQNQLDRLNIKGDFSEVVTEENSVNFVTDLHGSFISLFGSLLLNGMIVPCKDKILREEFLYYDTIESKYYTEQEFKNFGLNLCLESKFIVLLPIALNPNFKSITVDLGDQTDRGPVFESFLTLTTYELLTIMDTYRIAVETPQISANLNDFSVIDDKITAFLRLIETSSLRTNEIFRLRSLIVLPGNHQFVGINGNESILEKYNIIFARLILMGSQRYSFFWNRQTLDQKCLPVFASHVELHPENLWKFFALISAAMCMFSEQEIFRSSRIQLENIFYNIITGDKSSFSDVIHRMLYSLIQDQCRIFNQMDDPEYNYRNIRSLVQLASLLINFLDELEKIKNLDIKLKFCRVLDLITMLALRTKNDIQAVYDPIRNTMNFSVANTLVEGFSKSSIDIISREFSNLSPDPLCLFADIVGTALLKIFINYKNYLSVIWNSMISTNKYIGFFDFFTNFNEFGSTPYDVIFLKIFSCHSLEDRSGVNNFMFAQRGAPEKSLNMISIVGHTVAIRSSRKACIKDRIMPDLDPDVCCIYLDDARSSGCFPLGKDTLISMFNLGRNGIFYQFFTFGGIKFVRLVASGRDVTIPANKYIFDEKRFAFEESFEDIQDSSSSRLPRAKIEQLFCNARVLPSQSRSRIISEERKPTIQEHEIMYERQPKIESHTTIIPLYDNSQLEKAPLLNDSKLCTSKFFIFTIISTITGITTALGTLIFFYFIFFKKNIQPNLLKINFLIPTVVISIFLIACIITAIVAILDKKKNKIDLCASTR